MKKHNQILIVVLVVQIVLAGVVLWPRQTASGGESLPLLAELETADVVELTVEDNNGERIELAKLGDQWVLPALGEYPTQDTKVSDLLDKLAAITTSRLVTRTSASHKRLQVARDGFLRRVEVKTAAGETMVLYLGSSPRYGATHVRLEGQDETYLTDAVASWEANVSVAAWIDTTYFYVVQDDIVSLSVENPNGTFTFTKDGDQWVWAELPEGEELNTGNVATLVSQASRVSMSRPLGKAEDPAYGLDDPIAVVTIETAEGTHILQVGAKFVEDNAYVVKSSDSEYYARVSEFTVSGLLEKTAQDLILPPPTPESVETPTP